MFWGLIMEPNKRYTQVVEKAFHLSMASLDASTITGGLVQVMLCYDNRNYLLCTLQKDSIWQVPLDLNFEEGTKIAFTCNGEGHVHLTGYLIPEEENLDDMDYDDEDEDEEEDEEIPQLVAGPKKRKALNSPKEKNVQKPAKKSKIENDEDNDDDESDSDNEDGMEGTLEDDSDDDLEGEEDEDDDEEEEDDDLSDDDEEEEAKPQQQISKKQKQKQNQQNQQTKQQNQQNQQQNKKEKNKMVNGKDTNAKPEKEGKQKKNKEDSKSEGTEPQQKKRVIEGGVQVEDIKVGGGAPAKSGKFVSVYYIGRLKNGKKFDQTNQGDGFKFRLGKGEVIKGWDVGIAGMKVGGKRRIVIPPNMGYGAKGSPPVIPPNSSLTFEVELKAVH